MDARERDVPHSYRAGFKRPWEEDTHALKQSNGGQNGWYGERLPPIEPGHYSQHFVPEEPETSAGLNNSHVRNGRESIAKKARCEGNDYNGVPRMDLNAAGKMPPSKSHFSTYDRNAPSRNAPTFSHVPGAGVSGQEDAPPDNLCRQCRRQTSLDQDEESLPECCEHCQKNPELALVTQAAAAGLTQLAETLRSGIASEKRGINPAHSQLRLLPSGDPPPIIDFGLKQTLHSLLDKINKVNELADKFVQQVPPGSSKTFNKDVHRATNGVAVSGLSDIMKRRIDDELQRPILDEDSASVRMHQRRRSLAQALSNEELPPIRTQSPYHQAPLSMDSSNTRLPNMNPPSAPNRQLPSPPGRSFPSPTSVHFSSPSGSTFLGPAGSHPQPFPIHAPGNVLPPITSGQSTDSALQAHTAALQHEVSIQKIAFSSLQGEHDKLLAAFSRSQSRASALEKKHQVSDGEIFSLTEEKTRLQAQVQELEVDVEELAKSRDEYRQAAVKEGAQYVEIVRMASQLEEKTGEERKSWNRLKLEMEQRIAELSAGHNTHTKLPTTTASSSPIAGDADPNEAPSSDSMDPDPTNAITTMNTHDKTRDEQADRLKAEIERLRKRCEEVEGALRAVRDESRSMENIVEALSKAGKGILRRVEDVSLGPEPRQGEVKPEPPPTQEAEQEPDPTREEGGHEEDIQ
ncbi:hypothetical protein ACMFMG_010958 [Clarireedia jacksonii]